MAYMAGATQPAADDSSSMAAAHRRQRLIPGLAAARLTTSVFGECTDCKISLQIIGAWQRLAMFSILPGLG